MSDTTREATVKANLEAVIKQRGEEGYNQILVQLLKDIDISLAMLVDAGASSGS